MSLRSGLPSPATLLRLGLLACVIALAGGFASVAWQPAAAAGAAGASPDAARAPAARDFRLTLASLARHSHWGSYTPRAGTAEAEPADRGPGGDAVQRSFRLIGIEKRRDELTALLLLDPRAPIEAARIHATPDGHGLFRARAGDTLADGISVVAVERSAIRLRTGSTEVTLQLYESNP